jgi:hypothetical protein
MNSIARFYLPLLHTLVEERAGVRRLPFRWRFMRYKHPETEEKKFFLAYYINTWEYLFP